MAAQWSSTWFLSRRLFLSGIAGVYAVAFGSLAVQVRGLFGERGIQPLAERLGELAVRLPGWEKLQLPSVLWLGASDSILVALCSAGLVLALCVLAGLLPRLCLFLCWGLYLSFISVGWPFLNFQWDALLLEAGLLAVLFAPGGLRPYGRREREPARVARWLVYWLLFRLMVLSGAVKLTSGDPAWHDGTALAFHYWTQPLPHRLSVFAHERPVWFRNVSLGVMFAVELGIPWLLWVPVWTRRLRQVVAGAVVLLMSAIFLTGNYGFFNLLTAVLCIPLLDDAAWCVVFRRARERPLEVRPRSKARRRGLVACAGVVVLLSGARALEELGWMAGLPGPFAVLETHAAALRSFNSYGLFRVMTRERPELLIEGSADGVDWRPYGFRYKPGPLERAPVFAGLHMPRLDWQLWFAALEYDRPQRSRWTVDFLQRLLEGSPEVLELLGENPFPDQPPRFVRARVALYEFATPEERAQGRWWRRGEPQPFLPVLEAPAETR